MASLREFKDDMTEEVTRIASKRSRRDQSCILKQSGNAAQMAFVEEVA